MKRELTTRDRLLEKDKPLVRKETKEEKVQKVTKVEVPRVMEMEKKVTRDRPPEV